MLSSASKLNAHDGSNALTQPQPVDVRLPIIETIVFGGGRKLDVFGGKADDPVIGVAIVVAARSRMGVVVGTDPTGGIHRSFESGLNFDGLASCDFHRLFEQVVLRAAGDANQILSQWRLLRESSVVRVILVIASVGTVVSSKVGCGCRTDADELHLAG